MYKLKNLRRIDKEELQDLPLGSYFLLKHKKERLILRLLQWDWQDSNLAKCLVIDSNLPGKRVHHVGTLNSDEADLGNVYVGEILNVLYNK